jgi:transposase
VTGKPLRKIGETVFEELDAQRAQLRVIRHVRPIQGPSADDGKLRDVPPVMADLPPRPLAGCAASAGLLAWLLVQKFANHLPLHRQEAIFGRDGMRIPKQRLCDWTLASGEALRPIVDRLQQIVCSGPVLQLDDTPVMCQAGRGEPSFRAYLWTFVHPQVDAVVHRFPAGRASRLLADELAGFAGTIVGDGYSGNPAAADKIGPGIPIGACWAHVTRKLRDAEDEAPSTAKPFPEDIRQLFAVEREATDARLDPDGRVRPRRETSRPILGTILARSRRVRGLFPDAGKMAKAMQYGRDRWRALRQFLRQGLVPIDNNEVERAVRPIAI